MFRMFLRQSVVAVIARFGASATLAVGKREFLVDVALLVVSQDAGAHVPLGAWVISRQASNHAVQQALLPEWTSLPPRCREESRRLRTRIKHEASSAVQEVKQLH